MLRSVSAEAIFGPVFRCLSHPVQVKPQFVHDHCTEWDLLLNRLIVQFDEPSEPIHHSEWLADPSGYNCQIISRITDLCALPINDRNLAASRMIKQQVLRKQIPMQNCRRSFFW